MHGARIKVGAIFSDFIHKTLHALLCCVGFVNGATLPGGWLIGPSIAAIARRENLHVHVGGEAGVDVADGCPLASRPESISASPSACREVFGYCCGGRGFAGTRCVGAFSAIWKNLS